MSAGRKTRSSTPAAPTRPVTSAYATTWTPPRIVRRPGSSTAHLPTLAGGRLYPHWCQPR